MALAVAALCAEGYAANLSVFERRIAAARAAGVLVSPNCGLAPGMACVIAAGAAKKFSAVDEIHLRVGGLPQHPRPPLNYQLVFSAEGLINEYGNPCESIANGRAIEAAPLEGLEEISIDGTLYEAFNTSGGLGSLGDTYGQRAESMDYKTMRYPGHCEQMRLLMNDLKLNQDRSTLKRILENAVPQTLQDVVIVYVAVAGTQEGSMMKKSTGRFLLDSKI